MSLHYQCKTKQVALIPNTYCTKTFHSLHFPCERLFNLETKDGRRLLENNATMNN